MNRETWWVRKDDPVLSPGDLKKDPDKHGGLSLHMAAAIYDGVTTILLQDREYKGGGHCCVSIQVTSRDVVARILAAGKIEILSNGYWLNIRSNGVKPVFHGTDEAIPVWRGGLV
jgi:hypothetical protein